MWSYIVITRPSVRLSVCLSVCLSVHIFLCSLYRLQLWTDFFYFWYMGLWHHKEEPYRFWCRSYNFSPIYSLKLSIFMTKRLVNISCSLYRLQLLTDFFYFWYVGLWHHKEEPYWFWCRSDNFSSIYSLKLRVLWQKGSLTSRAHSTDYNF